MANLTTTRMAVVLPTAEHERFLGYFGDGTRRFHRTELVGNEIVETRGGLELLTLDIQCDWAVQYTMYQPPRDDPECIDLREACEECGVRHLSLRSEEEGCGFYEFLNYDKSDGRWKYVVMDRPRNPEDLFLDEEEDS